MSEGIPKSQSREGMESSAQMTFEEAEQLFQEDFLGPKEVEQVFGYKEALPPPIPFSREELERAKELGQQLILYTDKMKLTTNKRERVVPITLENLKKRFPNDHDGNPMFFSRNLYGFDDQTGSETSRMKWRLTSPDVLPDSIGKDYISQTDVLIDFLERDIFKGGTMPREYRDAINEFKRQKDELSRLAVSEFDSETFPYRWKEATYRLNELAITKLTRELPVEVLYRLILNDQARQKRQLSKKYTWTGGRSSRGDLVYVGNPEENEGTYVGDCGPWIKDVGTGVCLSRGS